MAPDSPKLVNGRYRLIRPLGEGGMGVVYLAADLAQAERPVALKKILAPAAGSVRSVRGGQLVEGPPQQLDALKSEFEAMTRLRHPNVVEVYDFGVDESSSEPFITLEYVEGTDLREAASRLPLDARVELLAQVCRGLEYIHSRELIHNDLKPQNILVTRAAPATCKLMDFGLASLRPAIGQDGSPAARGPRGTLQYLAPELIHGGRPDRRSDIYSLGVLFYSILADRLPFSGDPSTILNRALEGSIEPPSRWKSDLPPAIEALVLRMMARDPGERPGSAAGIIRELSEAAHVPIEVDTPATLSSMVRSAAFVGRGQEMSRLSKMIEAAAAGSGGGRAVMLSGVSGSGRSRLARQIRFESQLKGVSFAGARCYEGSGSAFHPFVEILRQVSPDPADERLAPLLSAALAPASDGAPSGPSPRPANADAEGEQRRTIDAATQAILKACTARPHVICVEDIHWADSASLALLEHLARNAVECPGLILMATYRSEEADAPPLSTALSRLARAAPWDRIELRRLSREEIARMVSGMLGLPEIPGDLLELIDTETGGNPFFVQVAVESLLEEQALARPGAGWVIDVEHLAAIPFPGSVAEAIGRRIAALDPAVTRVLEALAVAERPAEVDLLGEALADPDDAGSPAGEGALEGAVETLIRRHLAAREIGASGVLRIRIDHARVRDHVYETMDWQRRARLHGRFGRALEATAEAGIEEIAHHYINAPDAELALDWAEKAGLHAMGLYASARAIGFLERAVELVPPTNPARRLRVQLALADACRQARDHVRAVETYERVIKGARAAGDKEIAWSATCHLLDVQFRSGQIEEGRRLAERVIETLRSEGERSHLAFCLTTLGSMAAVQSRFDETRRLNEEALALRRESGDLAGMASNLNNLGLLEFWNKDSDVGRERLEESLALRKATGDTQRAAEALSNLAIWYQTRGALATAAERLEEAAELSRTMRDRWLLAHQESNLARIHAARGMLDRAQESARRAVASARAVGAEEVECEALDHLGAIQRTLGDVSGALASHERAAEVARRAGSATQEGYALVSCALDRLEPAGAGVPDIRAVRDLLRKAAKIVPGAGSTRLQSRLQQATARALLAEARPPAALEAAREARNAAEAGNLADEQAASDLLVAECLLAQEGDAAAEESARAALRAVALAGSHELAEPRWRGHALAALAAQRRGARAEEREAVLAAAGELERIAGGIGDEQVRLAYLAEPRRRELRHRASVIAERAGRRAAGHPATSPERALTALYEISGIINSLADTDSMLSQVMDVALRIVGAERGLIILLDEATGEQQVRAARDLEEETVRDALAYSRSVVQEAAAGRVMVALDAASDDRLRGYKSVALYAIKSLMCVPMKMRDRVIGTVYVDSIQRETPFNEQDLDFLQAFANLAASAVEQARLHEKLAAENVYLRREADQRNRYQNIIGRNVKMQAVYDMMEKVAASNLPVLIQGESGTGKELVARALHYTSSRRQRKFCSENVAAIPDTLLESEMFGHVRGAFTGADRDRKGLFETADGGTLFLDEIGDMSMQLQSKLLRALQDGEIRPVGAKESLKVDVRIISATNKDLEAMVREKLFREDLYYRLNVVRIPLPALRERKEDIPLLVEHFLGKLARESGGVPRRMEVGALQLLLRYSWPGNVRELENEIQRLAVLCPGDVITQRDVMENGELFEKITRLEEKDSFTPLEEVERRQIEKALMEAAGNRGRAAELLGISRATIFRKLRKFGISH